LNEDTPNFNQKGKSKMPTQNQKKQIIKELQKTALGEAFHGKALRAAKEIFPLTEDDLETIDAWETGKYSRDRFDRFEYRMRLQDIAIRM
jgi:hypothetical protein